MNRIDRLFAILLALRSKRRIRSEDLAGKFEVSKRTIYRDISALAESGVPIVSLPGEGYELMEGYYLPPLNFTETEATALILGTELLKQQAAGSITLGADQSLDKIKASLPRALRERVEAQTGIISFLMGKDRFNLDDPRLVTLQKAIQARRVVHIRYHGYERDKTTNRIIEPSKLYYLMGAWYVGGYCRLRREARTFRLSRIEKLVPGTDTFVKRDYRRTPPEAAVVVRIRFNEKIVRWVRERQHFSFQKERTGKDGTVMTYLVPRPEDILSWLLSWGTGAEALTPKELRDLVRDEAEKILKMLT